VSPASPFPRFDLPATFWRDALRLWEVGVSAPQVIALRSLRMAAAGARPSARDRTEYLRMSTEKWHAFNHAWAAMALEAWFYPLAVGGALARGGGSVPLPNLLGRGVAPVHRTVRANLKRLARP